MSVYVDPPFHRYRRGHRTYHMCHMMADTLEELFDMVNRIGVDPKWFQEGRYPHFDICKSKRELAIQNGAIPVSSKELIKRFRPTR